MAYIELKDIDAGYTKNSPILKDFHLEVEKGELVSLLGPSGCGKTTTLRTIAGFISPEKGKVMIDGKDTTKLPPNKKNIGLVFQTYALFPHLSVFDNIAYGLKRRKVEKSEIAKRVADVVSLVSLEGFEDRLPANLSGGQRQRVAIARSIVIEPDLLLLDEPLSNLDAKLREEMRAELTRLQHQLGITMIYVTHDQIEALSLSTKIVVMNKGNIEQIGTPEDIYERPSTSFVASFVGFDNSLTGVIESIDGDEISVKIGNKILLSNRKRAEQSSKLKKGDKVKLFFRPDDVHLNEEEADDTLEMKIKYSNYQGNSSSLSLSYGDEEIRAVIKGNKKGLVSTYVSIPPEKIIVEKE